MVPTEPLFFLKSGKSLCTHNVTIPAPKSYDGKVIFEGEIGIVIGKQEKDIFAKLAASHIFGYTCVNDVTALASLRMRISGG